MSVEAIALALVSTLRPTALAAVYALLSTPRPRTLLVAYIAAGFTFSTSIGLLVVLAFHGADFKWGESTISAVVDVLAGVAAVGFAGGLASGRMALGSAEARGAREPSWAARKLRDPSVAVAAGAGMATHLPGLFYLLGLNAIIAAEAGLVDDVLSVVIYNAIWFATAFASLVVFLMRPDPTREALAGVDAWARRHARALLIVAFTVVGAYFTVTGMANLLD
jgi:hypothetical protein